MLLVLVVIMLLWFFWKFEDTQGDTCPDIDNFLSKASPS